jgi:hypothetical protein
LLEDASDANVETSSIEWDKLIMEYHGQREHFALKSPFKDGAEELLTLQFSRKKEPQLIAEDPPLSELKTCPPVSGKRPVNRK